ncbi:MAG: 50S ribosomal protein L24 [Chitinophagales bacterium]|nr:50S ribosomal protein L24 [Chitinophagales bacterium]
MKINIKKGDQVIIISGEDKGKKGEVLAMMKKRDKYNHRESDWVLVDGINIITKHQKPDANNPDGGIVKKEAPVHISNVMLVDPKTGEATRVGRKNEDGKSIRYAKKSGEVLK